MQSKVAVEHRDLQEGRVRVEVHKKRNEALREIPEASERLAEVLLCKSKVGYL